MSKPIASSLRHRSLDALRRWLDGRAAGTVYTRWAHCRPRRYDRNLVVIGAGAAGLVTAYVAAAARAEVTLVEAGQMGGDCLNTGCVPSKALIHAATLAQRMRQGAPGVAAGGVQVDFAQLMDGVAQAVRAVAPHDSVQRYQALGVDVQLGRARILDPWHVQITHDDGRVQVLATRAIVVATGARPLVPPLPGIEDAACLTSETLWGLRELPRRLLVLGGGAVGCELAQAFARLGSQVTLVEQAPRLLAREDVEVSAFVQAALQADGVTVLTGHEALRCERAHGERSLVVDAGSGADAVRTSIAYDVLLCAVGRVARLQGLGLEELGIAVDGRLATDAHLQTIYPNILAAGDVVGPYAYTHMAAHQAWYAAVNALFGDFRRFKADYRVVPRCTFVDPQVAQVGLTEQEARAQGVACEITRYELCELDRAIAEGAARGWVQVLTVPGKDRILGVTIVAAQAGEMLAPFVLAMTHGLGLNRILATIHAYPTWAEAGKNVAGQWRRAHMPQALLGWAQRFNAWRRG